MKRYELDWLEEKFMGHGLEADKQREEMVIRWEGECHVDKMPEHLTDTFNLPFALLTLVQEIKSLRVMLADMQRISE
jgi:hypothetical protein